MDLLITFAAFFVLALFIRAAAGTSSGETYPYDRHTYLLSKAERSFIGVLEQAAPQHTRIFSKVRMADVICVRKGTRNPLRFFNRISAKHFDFVLCDARSSEVIAVIELDDSSHRSNRSRRTDEFKNKAAEAAGVPLIRIKAARSYVVTDLRLRLSEFQPDDGPVAGTAAAAWRAANHARAADAATGTNTNTGTGSGVFRQVETGVNDGES